MNSSHCSPRNTKSIPWRLRIDGALSGEENMAIDSDLLDGQKYPRALPTLRFFQWKEPTISYGRLQDAATVQKLMVREGWPTTTPLVQRPTGGGAVYHKGDLSFSLAWSRHHPAFPKCLREIYRFIHETFQTAFGQNNLSVKKAAGGNNQIPGEGICFQEPQRDDLLVNGKKVLGGALRVTSGASLYQGNLLEKFFAGSAENFIREASQAFEEKFFHCPPYQHQDRNRIQFKRRGGCC